MGSRLSKYDVEENITRTSRVKKNEELYLNINKGELDNYNVMSNTTILGENKRNEIDIEKIKKILDTKYNDVPKKRSIRLEEEPVVTEKDSLSETTKEYDINAILNKARSEKPVSYENDRAKKIRDTQFDILKNLELENKLEPRDEIKKAGEDNLLELINTITINEEKKKQDKKAVSAELDLFEDLKGNENTIVVDGAVEAAKITPISEIKKEVIEKTAKEEAKINNTMKLKEEFYTTSTKFAKKDFEDIGFDDGKRNVVTEIIVVIILIAFLVGMFFFFKNVFGF